MSYFSEVLKFSIFRSSCVFPFALELTHIQYLFATIAGSMLYISISQNLNLYIIMNIIGTVLALCLLISVIEVIVTSQNAGKQYHGNVIMQTTLFGHSITDHAKALITFFRVSYF